MSMTSRLFSFPGLTLAATVQSLLAIKMFPSHYSSGRQLLPVVVIFLANYVLGLAFWCILYPVFISPLRHLPGPKAFISSVHRALIVKHKPSGDVFLDVVKQYPRQDLLVLNALRSQILITTPRLFADLLVHRCYDFAKPPRISSFLRHILGDGLIMIEGDQHKFLRKNTAPAFHFRHIKELYPMMWNKAGILTGAFGREIQKNRAHGLGNPATIELSAWASKVTLDIIGVAGLGRNFDAVEKQEDPLQGIYEQLLEPSREKIVFAMLSLGFGLQLIRLLPWKMNDLFNHLTTSLNNYCWPMIHEKRLAVAAKEDDHFDVLSLLIRSNNFSDETLKDQLLTFLAAGHETTASAFTWACYLLTKHPDVQEKLREEIDESLSADTLSDPPPDLADILERLPYLNGIIHETLRLYPTVPMTMRQAMRDTHIGDQFIPKGIVIVVSIWLINRSPDIWGPGAGRFEPERWISGDGKPNQHGGSNSNYDFLTFLHGPRSCIGQGFAKAEMRCLLAAMVKSFSWSLDMEEKMVLPRGVVTIKPENGLYLRLVPRQKGIA